MKVNEDKKIAVVTNHGGQRVKDRLGISKKIADKISQKALDYGIGHSEAKGSLRRFMDALYFREKSANNIKIYNRKVYIFRDVVLITVLNLPNKYSTIADKLQKSKIKDTQEIN